MKGKVEAIVVPARAGIYSLKLKNSPLRPFDSFGTAQDKFAQGLAGQVSEDQNGLTNKIADLETQISVLKTENQAVRRLLGTPSLPQNWHFLPAQVIGLTSTEILQINQGRQEGVKEGMAVISEGNIFVGSVKNVGEHFANILLPISKESKILGVVRGKGEARDEIKAKGILEGLGGRMNLEQVTMAETLEVGDLLVTAGEEPLPPNILIGRLSKVSRKEGELFQKAEIEPAVNYSNLEMVFVIVN